MWELSLQALLEIVAECSQGPGRVRVGPEAGKAPACSEDRNVQSLAVKARLSPGAGQAGPSQPAGRVRVRELWVSDVGGMGRPAQRLGPETVGDRPRCPGQEGHHSVCDARTYGIIHVGRRKCKSPKAG